MNSDSALLKFADELLVKIVEYLPMKDRASVRAACSRLEQIVSQTDLIMPRYVMQFYNFNGTPWSSPFGIQEQGIDSTKMQEFVAARSRLVKRIKLSEVVLDQINFEMVDFDLVRILLTDCSFDTLYIVQQNIEYNERVESLIAEYQGKKIVFSALYFPYFECIDRLPADIELRFNYLHREKIPSNGRNEDLVVKLARKGHSFCAGLWSLPATVNEVLDVISQSTFEQVVTLKTFDMVSVFNTLGVEKTDGEIALRAGEGARNLCRLGEQTYGEQTSKCCWSFTHMNRLYLMTNGENLIWISNRPFQMLMTTCPMHCGLCESIKNSRRTENEKSFCDTCAVCRCASFYRF